MPSSQLGDNRSKPIGEHSYKKKIIYRGPIFRLSGYQK